MHRWSSLALLLALSVLAGPPPCLRAQTVTSSAEGASTSEFVNGRWFDGATFVARTMFAVNGMLTDTRPARVDTVIDLASAHVVPPFGEAHNHNVGGRAGLQEVIGSYLRDGVFYVENPNSIPRQTGEILDLINVPSSIDFTYANGGLTATGGHPIRLYAQLISYGSYPGWTSDDMENQAYHVVDDLADLDRNWRRILGGRPHFIKVYLLYSEEYESRKNDTAFYGAKGLDPDLVPEIVARARAAGLRVTAHVETALDFHHAVRAGVDEIAHTPGYVVPRGMDISRFAITEADARRAAERGISVVTATVGSARTYARSPERLGEVQANQRRNLRLLASHGVELLVGSDAFWTTSLGEALNLHELGVFDNRTLLGMLSVSTPRNIFPGRRIGHLRAGYEASFLALECDPIENFECVGRIALRVKQGHLIRLEDD